MEETAQQHAIALAQATQQLRRHLEAKQEALQSEQADTLTALLIDETLLVKNLQRQAQALDRQLHKAGFNPRKGGYGSWITDQLPLIEDEASRAALLRLPEDTIACQELQLRQQELMRHSLIYYQSMVRLLSGVREITYAPPKKQ